MVQNFVQSFRYINIEDDVHSNRALIEVLFDGCGCCVELSVLEAVLLRLMGFESAVLFKYSPRRRPGFHAVGGVWCVNQDGECIKPTQTAPDGWYVCSRFSYLGSDVSEPKHDVLGFAKNWLGDDTDAETLTPSAQLGQVFCVSLVVDKDGNLTANSLDERHWQTVKTWYL